MEKAWEQIKGLVNKPARVRLTRSRVQGHQRSESTKRHGPRPSYWSKSPRTCAEPLEGIGRSLGGGGRLSLTAYDFALLSKPDRRLDRSCITDEYNFNLKFLGLCFFATPSWLPLFPCGPILEPRRPKGPRMGPSIPQVDVDCLFCILAFSPMVVSPGSDGCELGWGTKDVLPAPLFAM